MGIIATVEVQAVQAALWGSHVFFNLKHQITRGHNYIRQYTINGRTVSSTEDTVRPLIKRGEHEETPGFQNFAVFCPLCIVRGTGVCRTHIEVGYLVVARGTGWG